MPIKILLQTTIPPTENDWHIGRFSLLRAHLARQPGFEVTARDRGPLGLPDPVLSKLHQSDYDELWLFAVDVGDGLSPEDHEGITQFRRRGGGALITRDHMDLGCSVCSIPEIGAAHYFHSRQPDPDPNRLRLDDGDTPEIRWPNYHSGKNGDYQEIVALGAPHPLLAGPVSYLPAHPHEGGVGAPPGAANARVIATGRSQSSGNTFNIAVAFERTESGGPALAESTFHHFADYNWDIAMGAPSFVTEAPGRTFASFPEARKSSERYVRNLALWLVDRPTT
ncbi:MAG TPA: hypothetical protein VGJ91_21780 [Polyangiaceae bacterium]|jgi:hypothetical protein